VDELPGSGWRGIVAASLTNRFQDALAIAQGLAKMKD
jgi:hypothetical protein